MDYYIKRSDAIKETRKPWITRAEFCRRICNIPPADVRPVEYARWIDLENPNYSPFDPTSQEYDLLCSHCGATHYGKDKNFCPNCGAKMGGTP